jgi:putative ABC transport system ATP-binding protein
MLGLRDRDCAAPRSSLSKGAGDSLIEIRSVRHDYRLGSEVIHALRGVDLTIRRNEFVAISSPSG